MEIKEHYRRNPEAMRAGILRAARELFVRDGYQNVSIRKIAERIEYSAGTIYLYFRGKADIFAALAEEGFRRFSQGMSAAHPGDDLQLALEEWFWRYYEFSKKQPEYFWLMFVDRSVPHLARDWERFAPMRGLRTEGMRLVRQCIDSGLLPAGTRPDAAFHALVTAVHGAAVQRLSGGAAARRDADTVARDALRATMAGLRAGVALDLRASAAP